MLVKNVEEEAMDVDAGPGPETGLRVFIEHWQGAKMTCDFNRMHSVRNVLREVFDPVLLDPRKGRHVEVGLFACMS